MSSEFYGRTYTYVTPNAGAVEIGVFAGLGGTPIVGWTDGVSRHRLKTHLLPAGLPSAELQERLDAWAAKRQLPVSCPQQEG